MNDNRERGIPAGGFNEAGLDLAVPIEASEAAAELDDVDGCQ